jgi:hypothetical protein
VIIRSIFRDQSKTDVAGWVQVTVGSRPCQRSAYGPLVLACIRLSKWVRERERLVLLASLVDAVNHRVWGKVAPVQRLCACQMREQTKIRERGLISITEAAYPASARELVFESACRSVKSRPPGHTC